MQRHTPMGYRIVNGKAEIIPKDAEIVKGIFEDYLNGTATYRIAKKLTEQGIPNANRRPSWSHCSVGKILENQRYKGDDFYPALIDTGTFERVQERRRERAESLGRTAQLNSYAKKSLFGEKIVCGICGQPYRKYVEHCNQPGETIRWKCKRYIKGNRVYCRNIFLTEEQIEDAILAAINYFIENPDLLEQGIPALKTEPENVQSRKLTGQIQECLENGQYSADTIRQMVFDRARAQYQAAAIDDMGFRTEKLKTALTEKEPQIQFDQELFQQTIQKIIVGQDSILRIELLNGISVEVKID